MFNDGQAYFITQRCIQSRMLLTPSPKVNDTIGGILAKATQKFVHIHLHDFVFVSNHFHLLITANEARQISKFMGWLNREISVRVGKLVDWSGGFFDRRFDAAPVLDDDAMIRRVTYIRSHGVKEGLVAKPDQWPGLTAIPELHHGEKRVFPFDFRTQGGVEHLPIRLMPLPQWARLGKQSRQQRHKILSHQATEAAHLQRGKKPYLGAQRIASQHPHHRPKQTKRSPRIPCFASRHTARVSYAQTYKNFVEQLRLRYDDLLAAWRQMSSDAFCLPGFGMLTAPIEGTA